MAKFYPQQAEVVKTTLSNLLVRWFFDRYRSWNVEIWFGSTKIIRVVEDIGTKALLLDL